MSFEKHITPKLCSIILFQGRFVYSKGGGGGPGSYYSILMTEIGTAYSVYMH